MKLLQDYQSILKRIVLKRKEKEKNLPADKKTNEFDYNVRFDDDITAAVQLFEKGNSVDDVIDVLKNVSPIRKRLVNKEGKPDAKAVAIYVNRVLAKVNHEFLRKSDNAFALASEVYKQRISNLEKKYEHYSKKNFGLYQDGQVALALVIKDGFSPDVIEAVLRRTTIVKDADDTYFATIRKSLDEAVDRYQKILAYNKDEMESEGDIYRNFAKQYMASSGVVLLSGADELNILNNICTNIIENVREDYPELNDAKSLDELIDSQIEPILRKGIIEASPVYVEAGRDKDQYLFGCITDFTSGYEMKKRFSSSHYPVTHELYLERMQELKEEISNFHATHTIECMDALTAKELLDKQQNPINILRAITENTEYDPSKESMFHSTKEYASFVLDCAKQSLHAEKEIINLEPYEELPKGKKFSELGITLQQLYRQVMRSRIDKTPSFQLELSEPFADRDAVEEIIHMYPDVTTMSLKEAIVECSPRAQLPGISRNYADDIINSAMKRLQRVETKLNEKAELQQEYNKLRGLATEGVYENKNPMGALKDGRIALKMLRRHINRDDIKKYLIALAKAAAITTAVTYAGNILNQASAVLEREQAIANFKPDMNADQQSCVALYKSKMHDLLTEKGQSQPSMDIQTTKELMKETSFTPEQIQRVVLDNSPIAEEPGRDENYAEYVRRQAELEIQQEKEKMKRYVPVPHLEKSDDIDEEYKYQKNKVHEYAPFLDEHDQDILIAKGLLASGFVKDKIEDELNFVHEKEEPSLNETSSGDEHLYVHSDEDKDSKEQSSSVGILQTPLTEENNTASYGFLILMEIEKEIAETLTETYSEEMSLVRTIDTTTTTTTTTTEEG